MKIQQLWPGKMVWNETSLWMKRIWDLEYQSVIWQMKYWMKWRIEWNKELNEMKSWMKWRINRNEESNEMKNGSALMTLWVGLDDPGRWPCYGHGLAALDGGKGLAGFWMVVETKFNFFDKCNLRQKMNEWGDTGIIIVPLVKLGRIAWSLEEWRSKPLENTQKEQS